MKFVQNALDPDPHTFGFSAGHWQLPLHTCPGPHFVPHPPQLFTSFVVFAQYVGLAVGQAVGCDDEHVSTHPVEEHI